MDDARQLVKRIRQLSGTVMSEHAALVDLGLGLVVGVLGLFEAAVHPPELSGENGELVLFVVPIAAAVALRRRWPTLAYAVTFGCVIAAANVVPLASFGAVLITAYTLAAYGRSRLLSFAVLLASAIFVTVALRGDLSFLPTWSTGFIIIGTLWLAGNAIRNRQHRADESEERALRLEREQEQARLIALAEERARIARELHDVVTHNVSVMVVQAGAARHVMKRNPAKAGDALLAVEARGREALSELRGFLGVLDGAVDDPDLHPQPGTGELEALVRGVVDAGLPVTLAIVGERRPLPHGVDLAAYRVVQEALTNALKYARGATTEVVVAYGPGELAVEVVDDGPGHAGTGAGGRGLTGLRERLAVYGGRLEAGRRPSGGYAVRAWIPTSAPV